MKIGTVKRAPNGAVYLDLERGLTLLDLCGEDLHTEEWLDLGSAPVSTPTEPKWFFAVCPEDPWSPMGNVHIACRYRHTREGFVRPYQANSERPATGWRPLITV
jgi:hypothetical protein